MPAAIERETLAHAQSPLGGSMELIVVMLRRSRFSATHESDGNDVDSNQRD